MGAIIEQRYRGRDVQKLFGIGQSTMYEYINRGILPKPIKLGGTSIWRGVAIFAKACFGHPSPSKQQKLNATTIAFGAPAVLRTCHFATPS